MANHAVIDEIIFDADFIEVEDKISKNLSDDFNDILDNYKGTFGCELWADNHDFY